MQINPAALQAANSTSLTSATRDVVQSKAMDDDKQLRETFDQFVGETFFGQMLASMRSTLDKPAYFHGGRAEEIFQGQLDQILTEKMTSASAHSFTGPMFELFNITRK